MDFRQNRCVNSIMITLANSIIKMYRKKDGRASLRLRSYLLVHTNVTYSLYAYLRSLDLSLRMPTGESVQMDHSYTLCTETAFALDTMVHEFTGSGVVDMQPMVNTVAILRIDYHLSFTGHPTEKPEFYETKAPLIAVTHKYNGA